MTGIFVSLTIVIAGILSILGLRQLGLAFSDDMAVRLGFAPFMVCWAIGAASGASSFSAIGFETLTPMENGMLQDEFGNLHDPAEVFFGNLMAYAGAAFFEAAWGAWFFTAPAGARLIFESADPRN